MLSIDDDDSFYRNVTRRLASRSFPTEQSERSGIVFVEIDGLSEPVLRRALGDGDLPTLRRWLESGSHRLVGWECGLPSQTSASQAGILFGDDFDIPAFRWLEKERGRLVDSKSPRDAEEIERRVSDGTGLLRVDGTSCGNLLSGDAERSLLTLSTAGRQAASLHRRSFDFRLYFLNPYNVARAILLSLWEIAIELGESCWQRVRRRRPRVSRGGSFPLLRATANVLLRDLTAYFVIEEMFAGRSLVYATFSGYDVVAHHAGPDGPEAMRVLRRLDGEIETLERASRSAPRPYLFVVLSDHGQSQGATFRQRHGSRLEDLVRQLATGGRSVAAVTEDAEGWSHANALLSEAARA